MVHPPKEQDELSEIGQGRDIDFDKLTAAQRSHFGEKWSRTTEKGESV